MFLTNVTFKTVLIALCLETTKIILMPNLSLLLWVCVLMVADFVTGVIKAKFLKEKITSERMRASVIKFLQYFGCLGLVLILSNQKQNSPDFQIIMNYVQDGLTILILYIEALSVLENLYQMDNGSPFSQYVIRPLYSILSMAVKRNAITDQAEKKKKELKKTQPDDFDDIDKAHD